MEITAVFCEDCEHFKQEPEWKPLKGDCLLQNKTVSEHWCCEHYKERVFKQVK